MKRLSQKIVEFFGIGYGVGLVTKIASGINGDHQLQTGITSLSNTLVMFGALVF